MRRETALAHPRTKRWLRWIHWMVAGLFVGCLLRWNERVLVLGRLVVVQTDSTLPPLDALPPNLASPRESPPWLRVQLRLSPNSGDVLEQTDTFPYTGMDGKLYKATVRWKQPAYNATLKSVGRVPRETILLRSRSIAEASQVDEESGTIKDANYNQAMDAYQSVVGVQIAIQNAIGPAAQMVNSQARRLLEDPRVNFDALKSEEECDSQSYNCGECCGVNGFLTEAVLYDRIGCDPNQNKHSLARCVGDYYKDRYDETMLTATLVPAQQVPAYLNGIATVVCRDKRCDKYCKVDKCMSTFEFYENLDAKAFHDLCYGTGERGVKLCDRNGNWFKDVIYPNVTNEIMDVVGNLRSTSLTTPLNDRTGTPGEAFTFKDNEVDNMNGAGTVCNFRRNKNVQFLCHVHFQQREQSARALKNMLKAIAITNAAYGQLYTNEQLVKSMNATLQALKTIQTSQDIADNNLNPIIDLTKLSEDDFKAQNAAAGFMLEQLDTQRRQTNASLALVNVAIQTALQKLAIIKSETNAVYKTLYAAQSTVSSMMNMLESQTTFIAQKMLILSQLLASTTEVMQKMLRSHSDSALLIQGMHRQLDAARALGFRPMVDGPGRRPFRNPDGMWKRWFVMTSMRRVKYELVAGTTGTRMIRDVFTRWDVWCDMVAMASDPLPRSTVRDVLRWISGRACAIREVRSGVHLQGNADTLLYPSSLASLSSDPDTARKYLFRGLLALPKEAYNWTAVGTIRKDTVETLSRYLKETERSDWADYVYESTHAAPLFKGGNRKTPLNQTEAAQARLCQYGQVSGSSTEANAYPMNDADLLHMKSTLTSVLYDSSASVWIKDAVYTSVASLSDAFVHLCAESFYATASGTEHVVQIWTEPASSDVQGDMTHLVETDRFGQVLNMGFTAVTPELRITNLTVPSDNDFRSCFKDAFTRPASAAPNLQCSELSISSPNLAFSVTASWGSIWLYQMLRFVESYDRELRNQEAILKGSLPHPVFVEQTPFLYTMNEATNWVPDLMQVTTAVAIAADPEALDVSRSGTPRLFGEILVEPDEKDPNGWYLEPREEAVFRVKNASWAYSDTPWQDWTEGDTFQRIQLSLDDTMVVPTAQTWIGGIGLETVRNATASWTARPFDAGLIIDPPEALLPDHTMQGTRAANSPLYLMSRGPDKREWIVPDELFPADVDARDALIERAMNNSGILYWGPDGTPRYLSPSITRWRVDHWTEFDPRLATVHPMVFSNQLRFVTPSTESAAAAQRGYQSLSPIDRVCLQAYQEPGPKCRLFQSYRVDHQYKAKQVLYYPRSYSIDVTLHLPVQSVRAPSGPEQCPDRVEFLGEYVAQYDVMFQSFRSLSEVIQAAKQATRRTFLDARLVWVSEGAGSTTKHSYLADTWPVAWTTSRHFVASANGGGGNLRLLSVWTTSAAVSAEWTRMDTETNRTRVQTYWEDWMEAATSASASTSASSSSSQVVQCWSRLAGQVETGAPVEPLSRLAVLSETNVYKDELVQTLQELATVAFQANEAVWNVSRAALAAMLPASDASGSGTGTDDGNRIQGMSIGQYLDRSVQQLAALTRSVNQTVANAMRMFDGYQDTYNREKAHPSYNPLPEIDMDAFQQQVKESNQVIAQSDIQFAQAMSALKQSYDSFATRVDEMEKSVHFINLIPMQWSPRQSQAMLDLAKTSPCITDYLREEYTSIPYDPDFCSFGMGVMTLLPWCWMKDTFNGSSVGARFFVCMLPIILFFFFTHFVAIDRWCNRIVARRQSNEDSENDSESESDGEEDALRNNDEKDAESESSRKRIKRSRVKDEEEEDSDGADDDGRLHVVQKSSRTRKNRDGGFLSLFRRNTNAVPTITSETKPLVSSGASAPLSQK